MDRRRTLPVALLLALGLTLLAAPARAETADPALRERAEAVLDLGHRGLASAGVDEDTISSCAAALSGGADGCEVDVRRSRDGVLFLLHDPTLGRVSRRCHGAVSRLPFWRIRRCHLRHGGVIPTYEEFVAQTASFAAAAGLHPQLLVEYKASDLRRRDVRRVLAQSGGHGFGPGSLMVESGSARMLRWSARDAPAVPRYLINFHVHRVVATRRLGPAVSGLILPARNLERALRRDTTYVTTLHARGKRLMIWGHSWGQGVGGVERGVDAVILDQSDRFDAWRDGR